MERQGNARLSSGCNHFRLQASRVVSIRTGSSVLEITRRLSALCDITDPIKDICGFLSDISIFKTDVILSLIKK